MTLTAHFPQKKSLSHILAHTLFCSFTVSWHPPGSCMPPGYTHLGVGQLGECLLGLDWLQELHNGCDASSWEQHPAQAAMFAKDSLQLCCTRGGWEVLHQDHSFTPLTSSLTRSVGEEEKEDVGLQKAKNNLLLTEDFVLNSVLSHAMSHLSKIQKCQKSLKKRLTVEKIHTPAQTALYKFSHTQISAPAASCYRHRTWSLLLTCCHAVACTSTIQGPLHLQEFRTTQNHFNSSVLHNAED